LSSLSRMVPQVALAKVAPAAPALARLPHESFEATLRPAGAGALGRDLIEFALDLADEPLVLCRVVRSQRRRLRVRAAIRSSRAKPESARNIMRVAGQRARIRATTRHLLDRAVRRVGSAWAPVCSTRSRSCVGGDQPSIECRFYTATFHGSKIKRFRATLCRHRDSPRICIRSLRHNNFR
jgi:hypothetical protein